MSATTTEIEGTVIDGTDQETQTHSLDLVTSAEMQPLNPGNLSLHEVGKIGKVFAQSGYFKDARGAAQAITKVLAGQEIGIPPFQAMAQFHVIEGKPTMSASLIGALVKRSGRYDYRVREHTSEACWIDWLEHVNGKLTKVGESRFTMEDAKRANLVRAGGGWQKYPAAMLFARALTAGARMYAPDVFGGAVYTPEELGAQVTDDGEYIPPTPPPASAPGATAGPATETVAMATVAQRRKVFAASKEAGLSENELRDLVRGLTGQSSTDRIPKSQIDQLLQDIEAAGQAKQEAIAAGSNGQAEAEAQAQAQAGEWPIPDDVASQPSLDEGGEQS